MSPTRSHRDGAAHADSDSGSLTQLLAAVSEPGPAIDLDSECHWQWQDSEHAQAVIGLGSGGPDSDALATFCASDSS